MLLINAAERELERESVVAAASSTPAAEQISFMGSWEGRLHHFPPSQESLLRKPANDVLSGADILPLFWAG